MGGEVMRRTFVFALLLGLATASVGAEIKKYEAPGNLESENDIGCVGPAKLKNTYTPADLYKAVSSCARQNKYEEGAYMFALAGVYGRYDTLRVADKSAHQAVLVLVMQSFGSLDKEKEAAFKESLKKTLGNPDERKQVCKLIDTLGPPAYYPGYMIQHGMGAFLDKPSENGLVTDFDSKAAWEKSLDTYLHCKAL